MKYTFGQFELDSSTHELRRNSLLVKVEPQVFNLLLFLLENQDQLVSSEQLIENVWRGRVVSDSAIAARISAARKAVDDDGKRQHVIKTIPRKGFRFVMNVQNDGQHEDQGSIPERSTSNRHQTIKYCRSFDGTSIAFAESGTGPQLIRAGHWLTHLEHDWQSPIWRPFLDQLGKNFSVIRYDQRGCGLSDRTVSDFSFERYVEDFEAVVEAGCEEKFILYATSQGVPVAVDFAVRNPHRVSHLILHGGYAQGRLVRNDPGHREQGEAIITLIQHGWGVVGSPFLQSFVTMYIPDANKNQMDSLVALQKISTSPENAMEIRRAADSFDIKALLPKIDVKTLVIHALNDGIHPVEQGKILASGIENSHFVALESSNHVILPQETAWGRLFDEITRFVES